MSGGVHGPALPQHCRSCRKVHAVRLAWHAEFPGVRLANALVMERCGLGLRTVQLHTGHLIRHRLLTADGLPVPGAVCSDGGEVPQDASPEQWAGCQGGLAPAARELLTAYAKHGWAGRVPLVELATQAGMSERTARTHRTVLVRRVLLEIRRKSLRPEGSTHPVRLPDSYRLMAGRDARTPRLDHLNDVAEAQAVADARQLVDAVWWYGDTPAQLTRAYGLVATLLLNGWPVVELARRLSAEPYSFPVHHPFGLLRKLLPEEWETYAPSAREATRGEIDVPGVGLVECPHCNRPNRPGPRMDAHVAVCRARPSVAPEVPVTPQMRAYVAGLARSA